MIYTISLTVLCSIGIRDIRTLKCLHCLVLFLCLFFWRFTDQISNFIGLMVCDDIPYVCIMCPGIGDIFVVVVYVSVF